jgi:hypothetical protein
VPDVVEHPEDGSGPASGIAHAPAQPAEDHVTTTAPLSTFELSTFELSTFELSTKDPRIALSLLLAQPGARALIVRSYG